MRVANIVLVAGLFASTAAQADWQFTRWGMTPEQVVKASGGRALALSADEAKGLSTATSTAVLGMPYQVDVFSFTVSFRFSGNRLATVQLKLDSGSAVSLRDALEKKYGPPLSESSIETIWFTADDRVSLLSIGSMAIIDYDSRTSGVGGL